MKIYIDTANIEQIKQSLEYGYVAGVTTNPSLMSKEDGEPKDILKEIAKIVDGPVSAEVISTDYQGMINEARELADIADNIVIKIPMTKDGLKAVATLSKEGIKTNVTLVFSANQGLLAAKAGATYVSPFVGRLDDIGQDGIGLVEDLVDIFYMYDLSCQVIAASIRHPDHAKRAALVGADIATIPFSVLDKMVFHPLTDSGLEKFLADYKKKR
ncbi:MAG: fructose-6-phosphate aldolase [Clostridia bacterium]